MNLEREIGHRLRRARRARGLTMKEVAEALGVTATAVHKWETGASRLSVSRLLELRRHFGISYHEILGHEKVTVRPEELES